MPWFCQLSWRRNPVTRQHHGCLFTRTFAFPPDADQQQGNQQQQHNTYHPHRKQNTEESGVWRVAALCCTKATSSGWHDGHKRQLFAISG